jgi:aryl-alcohol dehydrogenase-like predicted oxidoreductase
MASPSEEAQAPAVAPLRRYRLLGRSGLRVSPLCLGAMSWGEKWGGFGIGGSREDAEAVFNAYCDAGGNFIDTAVNYQMGQSEQWLGEFMKTRKNREELVIATKFSGRVDGDSAVNQVGNSRASIRHNVQRSLKTLQTDYIDLYWLHFWDFTTPPEEVLSTLHSLVVEGKVRYLGISDTPAWMVARLNTIAELRGWTPFIAYQGKYSLRSRDMDQDVWPMCSELGLGGVPWGALGSGMLTGKHRRPKEGDDKADSDPDAKRQVRLRGSRACGC